METHRARCGATRWLAATRAPAEGFASLISCEASDARLGRLGTELRKLQIKVAVESEVRRRVSGTGLVPGKYNDADLRTQCVDSGPPGVEVFETVIDQFELLLQQRGV
jgi:hypothetical protein